MARVLLVLGAISIFLGLLIGVGYQAYTIYDKHDLFCQGRSEAIPAGVEGNPYLYYRGWDYGLFPAELECKWEFEDFNTTTSIRVNRGADLTSLVSFTAGIAFIVGAVVLRLRFR